MSRIVFHHSGHGYGHAVRVAAVAAALPPENGVEIVGPVPWEFFAAKLDRPFNHRPLELDRGCVMSGALSVDLSATRDLAASLLARADELAEAEAAALRDSGAGVLVSDSGWLPLMAARRAGIPGVLLASFTWREIYAGLANGNRTSGLAELLPGLEAAYDQLSLHLKPPLAMEFDFDTRTRPVGLIAPQGRDVKNRLARRLGLNPDERLGLIYLGVFGQDAWRSEDLARLAEIPGWRWVGFEYDLDLPGYTRLGADEFSHEDVATSADAVLGKLGYSLLATCMAAGTPIIFPVRGDSYPECPALESAARKWGGGLGVEAERFRTLDITAEMKTAAGLEPPRISPSGAAETAGIIAALAR